MIEYVNVFTVTNEVHIGLHRNVFDSTVMRNCKRMSRSERQSYVSVLISCKLLTSFLKVKYLYCYREHCFSFIWRVSFCNKWIEELLLYLVKILNKGMTYLFYFPATISVIWWRIKVSTDVTTISKSLVHGVYP